MIATILTFYLGVGIGLTIGGLLAWRKYDGCIRPQIWRTSTVIPFLWPIPLGIWLWKKGWR